MSRVKEKRCVKIKGLICDDGRTQRENITREYASSSTISLEELIYTLVVDSYEGRDVAIIDVPRAYFNANVPNDKDTRLKLEGELVDLICGGNLDHIPNTGLKYGKKALYLNILKASYGCIKLPLLWYDLYVSTLK